jgi:hypothetical protein
MPRTLRTDDPYREKLQNLLPADITAAYLFISGIVAGKPRIVLGAVAAVLFILTFPYLIKLQKITNVKQIIFYAFSFLVWAFAVSGGTFIGPENMYISSTVLALWTLLIPLVI